MSEDRKKANADVNGIANLAITSQMSASGFTKLIEAGQVCH